MMGRDFETRRLMAILDMQTRDVQERYSFNEAQIHGECLAPPEGVGIEWRFETLNDAATEDDDGEWILTEIVFSTRDGGDRGDQLSITLEVIGEEMDQWEAAADGQAPAVLRRLAARACYCLGVEEEGSRQSLDYSLSEHEKLELRRSLPREFWPPHWREQEAQSPPD